MAGRINMMDTDNTFDTLIIGAGLAGLSAAYHLQDFQTLLLEQQPCAGGRISTQSFDGHVYDVGAVLGYDPAYLPFDFSPPKALEEQGPIGLFFEGHVHLGESVTDCLRAVFPEHSRESSTLLALQSGTAGLSSLTHNARVILNAFFQVIHPGEIEDYLPAFQAHAFLRYRPLHYINGNGGLIQAYLDRIHAQVEYHAEVVSLEKRGDTFKVFFKQHGVERTVTTRSLVIATPAPTALALLPEPNESCLRFLQSIRYGRFSVVALGVEHFSCQKDFSYMVTPGLPMTTIYKMTFPGSSTTIFLFYYCDRASQELWHAPDAQTIKTTCEHAMIAGLKIKQSELLFANVTRWKHGGTIISPESYGSGIVADTLDPLPGIFLAGDYLYGNFPYGMEAAICSGLESAERLRKYLRSEVYAQKEEEHAASI